MSHNIVAYAYEGRQFRTIDVDGRPWFFAKEVCEILEIGNASQAASRLGGDEKDIISNDTPSGTQQMLIVNESGLYALIMSSRKPEAKKFRQWVTKEVLPSIRETGSYSLEQPKTKLEMIAEGFVQMVRLEREHNLLREDVDVLEEKHEALEVKVEGIIDTSVKATAALEAIEPADEAPKPKTVRAKINELVRGYCYALKVNHVVVWNKLYHELKYRYSFDVAARVRNNPKLKPLDVVEREGYLNELYKIASVTCRIPRTTYMPPPTLFP